MENKHSEKVASFKAHTDPRILVYEMKEDELGFAKKVIMRKYRSAVDYNKWRANSTLRPLYGKPLNFSDRVSSEVCIRIKELIRSTGKDVEELAIEFRNYLGYRRPFFRNENGKEVPVDSQRILKAYEAMKARKPVKEVEKILFR